MKTRGAFTNSQSPFTGAGLHKRAAHSHCLFIRLFCVSGVITVLGNFEAHAQTAPSNDTCAGAVILTNNVYYAENTSTASDDTGLPCSYNGTVYKGVWFAYTAVSTGTLTVDTCPSTFDTKIEVFSGTCGALTSLGCNDDGCGLQSMMNLPCLAGTIYYICAGGFNGAFGDLQVRAKAVGTTNDKCASAVGLADNVYYPENTATATNDTGLPCSPNGIIYKGVWFAYTAVRTGTLTVDTCPSTFNTRIEVFGGACGSLSSLGCNDDGCGVQSILNVPCVSNATYYICAGGSTQTASNLWIRARAVALANDTCAGAVSLADNVYYGEDTDTATDDTGFPCSYNGTIYKGVWFAYQATRTGTLTVDTCPSSFDTKLEVFSGNCGSLTSLGCNDDACGLQSILNVPCVSNVTYYICAGGFNGAFGNLQIRAQAAAPPNDLCGGAITLADNAFYAENTQTATDESGLPCAGKIGRGVWFAYTAVQTGTLIVETCPSSFNTKLAVFSGTCGSLSSVGCNDDGCGLQSLVMAPCVSNTTYYICAGGSGKAVGDLWIRARALALTNDVCPGALVLTDNVYYAQNTATATSDGGLVCTLSHAIYNGVWFAYTPLRNGMLTVDTCPSSFDTKLEVFTGAYGSLTSLGCNDDACGLQSMLTIPCVGGTNYYICAGGFGQAFGDLQIRVHAMAPQPPVTIARAGGNVVIAWPTNFVGYSLYSATNITSPVTWSVVPQPPAIVGAMFTVTNSILPPGSFYSLK
jgi:hypothetical protein